MEMSSVLAVLFHHLHAACRSINTLCIYGVFNFGFEIKMSKFDFYEVTVKDDDTETEYKLQFDKDAYEVFIEVDKGNCFVALEVKFVVNQK